MKKLIIISIFSLFHYGICSENKIQIKYKAEHHPADKHRMSDKTYVAALNSIIVLKDEEQILELGECDFGSSFYCEIFIQTTYDAKNPISDGVEEENQYIIPLISRDNFSENDPNYFSKKFPDLNNASLPKIKLPNYNNDVVGFLSAHAGASGIGSRTLTLINLDTGQYIQIGRGTFDPIQWYDTNEGWGYISTDRWYMTDTWLGFWEKLLYDIGDFLGFNKKVFKFDEETFSFLEQKHWYNFFE